MNKPKKPENLVTSSDVNNYTPARIFRGLTGVSYLTKDALTLRADHAFARDAVWREVNPKVDFGDSWIKKWEIIELQTLARSRQEYIKLPQQGRAFDGTSLAALKEKARKGSDIQFVIGDGLSAAAVIKQVPELLPKLVARFRAVGWNIGSILFVHKCRVGVLNQLGPALNCQVVALLIGERPGLQTAESLSIYMAYRPQPEDTDAKRNLIANIHSSGVSMDAAVERAFALASAMRQEKKSGFMIKENSSYARKLE